MKKKIKTLKINRNDVLVALATEPLQSGSFIRLGREAANGDCTVCAVGAVLRKEFGNSDNVRFVGVGLTENESTLSLSSVPNLLKKRRYMSALSSYFEAQSEKIDGISHPMTSPKVIAKTMRFVMKHFPKSFTVKIS